jgi:hypothetical protein
MTNKFASDLSSANVSIELVENITKTIAELAKNGKI